MGPRQLRWELIWTRSRPWLKRGVLLALLLLNGLIWTSGIVRGSFWIAKRSEEIPLMERMGISLLSLPSIHRNLQPKPIEIGTPQSVKTSGSRVDLVATITNPNPFWAITDATVRLLNSESDSREIFFLPMEQKRVVFFRQPASSSNSSIIVSDLKWKRLHETIDAPAFRFGEPELSQVLSGENEETRSVSTLLRFTVQNESPQHWLNIFVQAALFERGVPIALNAVTLPKLTSREEQTVTMSWPFRLRPDVTVELTAEVNPFDESNRLLLPEAPALD